MHRGGSAASRGCPPRGLHFARPMNNEGPGFHGHAADGAVIRELLIATQRALRLRGVMPISPSSWARLLALPMPACARMLIELSTSWHDVNTQIEVEAMALGGRLHQERCVEPCPYSDGGKLPVECGDMVFLRGLQRRPDLEGSVGTVLEFLDHHGGDAATISYVVKLHGQANPVTAPASKVFHIREATVLNYVHAIALRHWDVTQHWLVQHGRPPIDNRLFKLVGVVPDELLVQWLQGIRGNGGADASKTLADEYQAWRLSESAACSASRPEWRGPAEIFCPACGAAESAATPGREVTFVALPGDTTGSTTASWTCKCGTFVQTVYPTSDGAPGPLAAVAVATHPPRDPRRPGAPTTAVAGGQVPMEVFCPASGHGFSVDMVPTSAGRLAGTLRIATEEGVTEAMVLYEFLESGDRLTVTVGARPPGPA